MNLYKFVLCERIFFIESLMSELWKVRSDMVIESLDCDKVVVEMFDLDEFLCDYNVVDVLDSDLGEEEWVLSGSENVIVLNIINFCFM